MLFKPSSTMSPEWAAEQSFMVPRDWLRGLPEGTPPEEKARILDMQMSSFSVTSLSKGAEDLNDEILECEEGICIVQDGQTGSQYCIFRTDKIEEAHSLFRREMSNAMADEVMKFSLKKNAHDFRKKTFGLPTWCDNCGGILVGGGYECAGPCGMRCHKGLGKGKENCYADMLMTPCTQGAKHKKVSGQYVFGDITKQIVRNIHQDIKNTVVQETVKEQRAWGKFEALKEQVAELKTWWDDEKVINYVLFVQLTSIILTVLGANALVFVCSHRYQFRAYGRVHAAVGVGFVTLFETLIILSVYLLARAMLVYSEMIHRFMDTILQIDLEEVQINLDDAAIALMRVSYRLLFFSTAAWVGATAAWIWVINSAD